jgi:hypothetical protein
MKKASSRRAKPVLRIEDERVKALSYFPGDLPAVYGGPFAAVFLFSSLQTAKTRYTEHSGPAAGICP